MFFAGFDAGHYQKTLSDVFGDKSVYEYDLGRPLERSDYPINAAYRDDSIKGFLANLKEGKEKTGADDSQVVIGVQNQFPG